MNQTCLTSLSHDMKTPLTAIALYNDLLRRMEPNDPERQTCHEIIADQISRLVQITNTVLGERSTGGNIVNLASLLKDTVAIYRKLYPDYPIIFIRSPTLWWIFRDYYHHRILNDLDTLAFTRVRKSTKSHSNSRSMGSGCSLSLLKVDMDDPSPFIRLWSGLPILVDRNRQFIWCSPARERVWSEMSRLFITNTGSYSA